ncbi:hypothetical protein H9W91_07420 [Streptomyces alfalfae]|uniref:hypothetical protein n=1 Tax=Streptomyces alfalfae TaxID=1642299 RepID=UPI001BAC9A70|nr:hypothetical protein [Streptomyces alfalfae]QUI30708.1 hypothetical protein H9W91_07420 [Streptomyces alfalfae]
MFKMFTRLFSRKSAPVAPVVMLNDFGSLNAYTVVLDWDGDNGFLDAPVLHVEAGSRPGAMTAAYKTAWDEYAGCIDEIPAGAPYDEGAASDLWYTVTILEGYAVEAAA